MRQEYIEGAPIPESLGKCVDLMKEVEALASAMQKEVDAVKARAKELKNHLIDNVSKGDDGGVVGMRYMARIVTKPVAKVDDWDKFREHILNTGDFSLMNKSISQASIKDVWESGEEVPGVGKFNSVTLSVNKVK